MLYIQCVQVSNEHLSCSLHNDYGPHSKALRQALHRTQNDSELNRMPNLLVGVGLVRHSAQSDRALELALEPMNWLLDTIKLK